LNLSHNLLDAGITAEDLLSVDIADSGGGLLVLGLGG
jgi:hypothetical protein